MECKEIAAKTLLSIICIPSSQS